MAAISCSKCGAEFDAPARFCRRCGNSLGPAETAAVESEAATKSFDQPVMQNPPVSAGTGPANQWPTSPAYLGPDQVTAPPGYPLYLGANTQGFPQQGMAEKRNKAPFIILGILGVVLVMVIAAFALIIARFGVDSRIPADPPNAESNAPPDPSGAGGTGQHAGHPPIPPPPPKPAPPGEATADAGPLADLVYPGSKATVKVHSNGEGTMILSTPDLSGKVMDWYIAKLPNADVVNIPFVGGGVISKGRISVTITPGSPTTIVLSNENKHR